MSAPSFGDLLVREIPFLRAFARSLSGSATLADDLVQDALVKAWSRSRSFEEGTNLRAWLITILRNTYFTQYRRNQREVLDMDGRHASQMSTDATQSVTVEVHQVQAAIDQLPPDQREVMMMIYIAELSYKETCEILGLPIGTVKSRLNRAKARLAVALDIVREDSSADA